MIGDIDSTFPTGLMHLVDRQSDLFHQHGGVVTAVHFDSLEEMSVDEFVTRVVPTLKGDKEHFTVIKDSTREQVLRILGDNVARYHIKDIQDVFFDTARTENIHHAEPEVPAYQMGSPGWWC